MKWTDEDRAALKRMADEGKSAATIAAALGRPRGSVCWQAARHKIRLRGEIGVRKSWAHA